MDALRELTAVIESLDRADSFAEAADRLTSWARTFSGCQTALLRLLEGSEGEPWLAGCSMEGHSPVFIRDEVVVGHADCLCGRVASGATDPSLPFYTQGGSFCWGRTSTLADDFSSEALGPVRGRCMEEGYESVAIFPIRAGDRLIGSLHLADHRPDHFAGSAEVIEAVCRLAGSILLKYRERERERAVLDTIQSALLPLEPPAIDGLEIGVSFGSATQLAQLGGDFYDVLDLGGPAALVLVGDVSGKGIEAAGIAAKARYAIDAQAGIEPDPPAFMGAANDFLARSLPEGRFVTAAACLIDRDTGVVTTCLAGHPSPLKISRAAGVELEAPHNPPLGLFPGLRFGAVREGLGSEDLLVLYTDGISDSRKGGDSFGPEGITRTVRGVALEDPREVARSVLEGAQVFHDPSLPGDDRLVVAVRLTGKGAKGVRRPR